MKRVFFLLLTLVVCTEKIQVLGQIEIRCPVGDKYICVSSRDGTILERKGDGETITVIK